HPMIDSGFEPKILELLQKDQDRVSGVVLIEPSYPEKSCEKMEKWIRHGPCIGIKYVGYNEAGIPCDHPNNHPIIKLAAELGAVVYIHTWLKVGGTPRFPGGGNVHGESGPMNVVNLARRFPHVPLICGHSGGDWELGVRAVRSSPNVYLEFAGS